MDSLIVAIEEASAIEKASASLLDIGDRPRKLAKTLSACSSVSIPSLASDSTVSEEQRSGDDSCSATMDTSSARSWLMPIIDSCPSTSASLVLAAAEEPLPPARGVAKFGHHGFTFEFIISKYMFKRCSIDV